MNEKWALLVSVNVSVIVLCFWGMAHRLSGIEKELRLTREVLARYLGRG